jgi:hypothetical protein
MHPSKATAAPLRRLNQIALADFGDESQKAMPDRAESLAPSSRLTNCAEKACDDLIEPTVQVFRQDCNPDLTGNGRSASRASSCAALSWKSGPTIADGARISRPDFPFPLIATGDLDSHHRSTDCGDPSFGVEFEPGNGTVARFE